jgi:hypothetical protein
VDEGAQLTERGDRAFHPVNRDCSRDELALRQPGAKRMGRADAIVRLTVVDVEGVREVDEQLVIGGRLGS